MKCCGEIRDTPFCAECGRPLGGPATELLKAIRSKIKGMETRINGLDDDNRYQEFRERAKAKLKVWKVQEAFVLAALVAGIDVERKAER